MADTAPAIADPAPVCLFAFNRPDHTARTLRALAASPLAAQTELIAYLDGPRSEEEVLLVAETRKVIEAQTGFASVKLHARDANAGLARSIQDGVTATMQAYGKAIVVEDDIVTSPAFLTYMNRALDRYQDDPRVWHIAGFNEDLPALLDRRGAIFWRFMSCWGWASWADRWQHFERDPKKLVQQFSDDDIHRFNLNGTEDLWGQVLGNLRGDIRTWAVFWYATIFMRDGLCLSPCRSFADNIGLDGSGTHCGPVDEVRPKDLCYDYDLPFPNDVAEDNVALEALRAHFSYRPDRLTRLRRKIRRLKKKVLG
ncbi:sugar transferase [Rhodobacteraceae bacterium B1Z28]|uniref:Sugar transferase n=1 Tax=Ruegeria haliotis TaxID=2747601 RepID=A0ABX2PTL9_9RHOB|nr:sugar transferase [Ruegeria haliotis]NVO57507.1 sugar transferase [Ruegeria haliotis]